MSCTYDRRRLRTPAVAVATPASSQVEWHAPIREAVLLRYRGLGPFTTRSRLTGRLYACGGTGARLQVEAADARDLVRTRLFKPA
jgi:hypothetical protein